MEFTDLYNDLGDDSVFANLTPAEPVAESLPHRGTPYEGTGISRSNPLFDYVSPDPNRYTPQLSESDADLLAEYEVDMMLAKLDMFVELGKGGIGEFLVSSDDMKILSDYQAGDTSQDDYVRDILSRIEIKNQLEQNKPLNSVQERDLLMKLAKHDNLKKRASGTLKMPTLDQAGMQMFINRFIKLSGNNPKVFAIMGKNIYHKFLG